MARPNINYRGSEWAAIRKELEAQIVVYDLANRDMTLDERATMMNRAMQHAIQNIIAWGDIPIPTQAVPPYALSDGSYDPSAHHPDDDPV